MSPAFGPRRALVAACVCALVVGGGLAPGVAADRPETDGSVPSGPFTTVAVGPNETVEGRVDAVGARTVVAGRVEGNLRAYGGAVVVTEGATVTGNVQAFGGGVVVNGTVRGPVTAYGGRVVAGGATGDLNAGGGTVRLAGSTGSATVLGGRVVLAEAARVGGDLEYDARLVDRGGVVAGARVPTDALLGPVGALVRVSGLVPRLFPLVAGALALGLPRLAPDAAPVVARARARPVRSLVAGVGVGLGATGLVGLAAASGVGTPLLGLAVPVYGAGALLGVAVGLTAAGGALAARLHTGRAPPVAVLALLAALPTVGPPAWVGLGLWGAGALAGGTTLKRFRAGVRVWT